MTSTKISRHQSLHLAQIRRLGGVVLSKTLNADGTLTVSWRSNGQEVTETVSREKQEA